MASRKALIKSLAAQLREWDAEIGKLETKGKNVASATKAEYHKQLDELRSKKAAAQVKLDELMQSGEGAWESLRSGAEKATQEMTKAFRSALSRFK